MKKFILVLCFLLFPTQIFAADYTVNSDSDNDCSDYDCTLQLALNAAAVNAEHDTITITQAGVYHGPFLIPKNEYSITIQGNSLLDREEIILDNPTAIPLPGMSCIGTIVAGVEEVTPGQFEGTAFTLKHLTITSAQLVVNESMEGEYTDGLASGWKRSGSIIPSQIVYGQDHGMYVLAGSSAQRFTNCTTADDYIYTTITGLNLGQEYGFSAWPRRIAGSGEVNIELIGAAEQIFTSTLDYFKRIDYKFTATSDTLTIRLYNTGDATTEGVVEEVSLRSLAEAGVVVKGKPAIGTQKITDCVIKNIGLVVGGLDDPSKLSCITDDIHGAGIAICGGANPLVVDCDIRNNYDGVDISDYSSDSATQSANPRFWSTGHQDEGYGQMKQRIRFNARFGIGVKNGATPYIGDSSVRQWPQNNANNIQANGFANIACQDDAAPRIYYNLIEGSLDYLFGDTERNPSGFGVIARSAAAPVLVGNYLYNHNKAALAMHDEATPIVGEVSEWIGNEWNVRVNLIYYNNLYADLSEEDPDYISCTVDENRDNEGCAAIAVGGFARPIIKNNYITNNWAGIGIKEWAVPTIQNNWFKWNTIGIGVRNMQLSGAATVRIGGSGDNEGNEFFGNDKGVVAKASGNPLYKVIIEGNEFQLNNLKGIGANNAYLEVRNNYINNKYAAGIGIKNSSHAVIINNEIDNSWLAGVAARDSFIHLENNILAGNQYGRFGPVVMLRAGGAADVGQPGYTGAGSTGEIRNNIIVGGQTQSGWYKAYGVRVIENSRLKELKHNIIGRLYLGVSVSGGTVDPGAVDYNLLYAWSNPDGDGYALGPGNMPGPHTYYYGEGYGNAGNYFGEGRPDPFFMDPNNVLSDVVNYEIDPNSPVWPYTDEAGYSPYLGVSSDFNYLPPGTYYRVINPRTPSADGVAPVITSISPENEASITPEIVVYIKDTKDGIEEESIELYINGNLVSPTIAPAMPNASNYRLSYIPATPFAHGDMVTVGVVAEDAMGNVLDTTASPYSFSVELSPADAVTPYLDDLAPAPDCLIPQSKDTNVLLHIKDDGVGIDASTITMSVQEGLSPPLEIDPVPIVNTDIYDYIINYNSPNDFGYNRTITVNVTAEDFNSNLFSESYSFCIEADTNPPEDITYFKAYVDEDSCSGQLTWEPSINSEGDLAEHILYLCSGDLEFTCEDEDWNELVRLGPSATTYSLVTLAQGKYYYKLTVVDESGNESKGVRAYTGSSGEIKICESCCVPPEEAIDNLANIIASFPDSAFKGNNGNLRNTLLEELDKVLIIILEAKDETKTQRQESLYQVAIDKLQREILIKTDGYYGALSENDWVIGSQYQSQIYPLILDLIDNMDCGN